LEAGIDARIMDCVKERYGVKEIFDVLREEKPDFIGINVFTQNYEIVKEISENCPVNAPLVIGGQVVKCIYNEILNWNIKNPMVIVIGEGELLMPAIVLGNCVEKPILNKNDSVVYRVDKNSAYYPVDLSLSHLNRAVLNNDIVTNHYVQREAAIVTSRGCMYNCAFCGGAHNLNKDISIRFRKISDVKTEITEILRSSPSVSSIRVLDDLFLRDEKSINNAIELFSEFPKLTWRGMAHILTFTRLIHTLPSLKGSGCQELFVGIESGATAMRKKINKPGTPEEVVNVVTAILRAGIDVKGYFMYGFPNETTVDADATFELASTLCQIAETTDGRFRASVFQFRPYHGTQLYDEILESGRKISSIKSNEDLNGMAGRSQYNFQSGNYSRIEDALLSDYIIKTQRLSEVRHA
jgi:radical SAM superfamily enzyme YgiQ (UPF0313 family)